MQWIAIFMGGGLGSLSRYAMTRWLVQTHHTFVMGTIVSNVLSCIILGFVVAWHMKAPMERSVQLFFAVGLCGGFSTFSTFTYENYDLLQNGQYGSFAFNIIFSVVACLIGIWIGMKLAKVFL